MTTARTMYKLRVSSTAEAQTRNTQQNVDAVNQPLVFVPATAAQLASTVPTTFVKASKKVDGERQSVRDMLNNLVPGYLNKLENLYATDDWFFMFEVLGDLGACGNRPYQIGDRKQKIINALCRYYEVSQADINDECNHLRVTTFASVAGPMGGSYTHPQETVMFFAKVNVVAKQAGLSIEHEDKNKYQRVSYSVELNPQGEEVKDKPPVEKKKKKIIEEDEDKGTELSVFRLG